jgi:hypothetical protein
VPSELLALLAAALVGPKPWLHERRVATRQVNEQWQDAAEKIWRTNPKLKNSAVARLIDPQRWGYIRKRIHKPQNNSAG